MHLDSILDGLARARASKVANADNANGICNGSSLINKITKKKFIDNEVNPYGRNLFDFWEKIGKIKVKPL